MATTLYAVARWVVHHAWTTIGCWLLLFLVAAGAATSFAGSTDGALSIPGTESQRALDLLESQFPGTGGADARVVVRAPEGHTLTEQRYREIARTAIARTAESPQVLAVTPYSKATLSQDQRTAFIDVAYDVPVTEIDPSSVTALEAAVAPARSAGLEVEFSGGVVQTTQGGDSTELYGVAIALVVLVITFGALIAAGLPLLSGILGVTLGILGIRAASGVFDLNASTPALATMLGLAVGIDYALFLISRHRDQRAAGLPLDESIPRAVATAGGAVVFAGATVVVALAALAVVGIPFLTAMGLAAAGTVVISVLLNLTLVPAVLALLGDRLDRGRIGILTRRRDRRAGRPTMGTRWAQIVTRRPWLTVAATVLAVGALALPLLDLRLGLPDDGQKPSSTTERRAYDLLSDGFGPGFNGPLTLVVHHAGATDAADLATRAASGLSADPGVASVGTAVPDAQGDIALLTVVPSSGPSSEATADLVGRIRAAADQVRTQTDVDFYVTGQTAINIDISDKLAQALPIYLGVIVVVALLLLLLVFRSLLVPLKAVVGFLLSFGAAMGTTVLVFQQGHLAGLLGVQETGPIISFLPVLLIGILFGLAMDYEVFLVSRVREEYLHTDDPYGAIVSGMAHGARVVTAAGLIMIAVFAGFIFGEDAVIKSLGLALSLGVLVDAFVVRMTLVPAVLTLLGRSAWWLPARLERALPDLDVEGTSLPRPDPEPIHADHS